MNKGSIKEGKLANLIILDTLTIELMAIIKNVKVLETIRKGENLYIA